MAMKTPVLSLLLRYINNTQKKDNNYDIAKGLFEHYHDIPKLTIHDMADACYVSSSSLSRFVHMIGYSDYREFKESCENDLDISVDYSFELSKTRKEDMKSIYGMYTRNIKVNLDYILANLDYGQIERISKIMYETDDIAFFGLEFATLLGAHFQIKMAELNKLVKIGDTYQKQKDIAESFGNSGIVFIASLEGGYFYHNDDILKTLRDKGVTIVALTMNDSSMIRKSSDEIILSSKSNSDTEGRISILYVIEILLMYYIINYKAISF